MFRMLSLFSVLLLSPVVRTDVASAQQPEFQSPLSQMDLEDGDVVVFLGDSITHQCLYTQYVETYFYTRFPNKRVAFHNAGVGGARAWDALQRFDDDVAAYKPKYVAVLLGMNDGRYQPFNKELFETYRTDMTEVVRRIEKAGAKPVLITPTMFDSRAARKRNRIRDAETLLQYNAVLAYYGAWLRETAGNEGYGFVDMYSRLNNATLGARKKNAGFTMIKDAVHPDPPGQMIMAYSILNDLVPRSPVSSILVARTGAANAVAKVSGGKISDPKFTPDRLEFTFEAKHLPWVLPDEAKPAVKMLRLSQTVNREMLQVLSLSKGQYELTIDGENIGTFSNGQLFRGLPLHDSEKTPQYKQAKEIAELNKKRNAGPVRSLRNEWRAFQQHARLKRELKEKPDDKKLAEQIAKLQSQLNGLPDRVKKHEQAAKEIEDKIFEMNKPKPRKYVLKKISLARVEGTVTLNGQPLAGAEVRFHGEGGEPAVAKTDKNGAFRLTTNGEPGVKAGSYRVAISSKEAGGEQPGKREAVPVKYTDAATTGLKFEVVEGDNQVNFDLPSR